MVKMINYKFSNKILDSIIRVFSANMMMLVMGMIITFILPIKLSTEDFGYWQMFVLYTSYCGFFTFGFSDGVNLRYAGKEYKSLRFSLFRTKLRYLFIFTSLISILMIIYSNVYLRESDKYWIIVAFSVNIVLFNIQGFFIHVAQMTSRFKLYSKAIILERVCLVVFIILTFYINIDNYKIYLIMASVSRLIVIVYFVINFKELVFGKNESFNKVKLEVKEDVSSGFFIMISAIITMLISSYVKFFIEGKLGVNEFSYFSFAISMLSLVLQAIMSISTVLYPIIRQINTNKLQKIFLILDKLINRFSGIILFAYYISVAFICIVIPKYKSVLEFLMIIFPIVILNIKNDMLNILFYKVFRYEKNIFYNNIIGLIIMVIFINIGFYTKSSIKMVSLMYLIAYSLITIISRRKLFVLNNWKYKSDFSVYILIAFFIIFNFNMDIKGIILYISVILCLIFINGRDTLNEFNEIRKLIKSNGRIK